MKKDSDYWSRWSCPTCGVEMEDPDNRKTTTCANGHTCYLGMADRKSQHRIAYATAKQRRKNESAKRQMCEMFNIAFGGKSLTKKSESNEK